MGKEIYTQQNSKWLSDEWAPRMPDLTMEGADKAQLLPISMTPAIFHHFHYALR